MNKVCIGSRMLTFPTGGEKAKNDATRIVSTLNGYRLLSLSCRGENIHISSFHIILELVNLFRFIKIRDSIIFVQHPFYLGILNYGCFWFLSKRNKIIVLSHDIESIRLDDSKRRKNELKLNRASCIISHNKKYTEVLREIGIKVPIVELGVFDYLLDSATRVLPREKMEKKVSFIGNLDKAAFLEDWLNLDRSYQIELIGNCNESYKKVIKNKRNSYYGGVFSPGEVPYKITGSFGLVWDGYSIESCELGGRLGKYLKYNNPHKFSLYIASNTPVIVWEDSALASFVKENGIGVTVKSLNDIDLILSNITEDDYVRMQKNISPIQEKIVSGGFLKEAVENAELLI